MTSQKAGGGGKKADTAMLKKGRKSKQQKPNKEKKSKVRSESKKRGRTHLEVGFRRKKEEL